MKIIFLDFDGVLNTAEDYESPGYRTSFLNEEKIVLLKEIVVETGTFLVLSTSWKAYWRAEYDLCPVEGKYIVDTLAKHGLSIFDKTEDLAFDEEIRVLEINRWLKDRRVGNYIALDDMELPLPKAHFVQTNPVTGLTADDVRRAVALLNKGTEKND